MNYQRAKLGPGKFQMPEAMRLGKIKNIIAGMGKDHGPRAPLRRIDPNSPEGRAIAERYQK